MATSGKNLARSSAVLLDPACEGLSFAGSWCATIFAQMGVAPITFSITFLLLI
jgi:hypothetical protein